MKDPRCITPGSCGCASILRVRYIAPEASPTGCRGRDVGQVGSLDWYQRTPALAGIHGLRMTPTAFVTVAISTRADAMDTRLINAPPRHAEPTRVAPVLCQRRVGDDEREILIGLVAQEGNPVSRQSDGFDRDRVCA